MNSAKLHQNRIICSKVMTNQLNSHKNAMKRHKGKLLSEWHGLWCDITVWRHMTSDSGFWGKMTVQKNVRHRRCVNARAFSYSVKNRHSSFYGQFLFQSHCSFWIFHLQFKNKQLCILHTSFSLFPHFTTHDYFLSILQAYVFSNFTAKIFPLFYNSNKRPDSILHSTTTLHIAPSTEDSWTLQWV